jgi:hypothetical protein
MGRLLRIVVFALGIGLLPLSAIAQVVQPSKVDPDKLRVKLLANPFIEGKLTDFDADAKRFRLEYLHQVKTPIAAKQKAYTDALAQFNAALRRQTTSLEEIKRLQAEGIKAEQAAFKTDETPIPFELQGGKSLAVRTLVGPDSKARQLTPAALKDLDKGKYVRVFLDKARPKPAPGTKPEEVVYTVTTIVLVPLPEPAHSFKIPGE